MEERKKLGHGFHLVSVSPWPFISSISLLSLAIGLVILFKLNDLNKSYLLSGQNLTIISLISLIICLYNWWSDVIIESTIRGEHTKKVQANITIGFILFVISEIMIFISLFYAYFYNSLVPSIELGCKYPPLGLEVIAYEAVPLCNTALLFFGSLTVTASQHSLISMNRNKALLYLIITIILNIIFTTLQIIEYYYSYFSISSIYGSSFYIITSMHGLHVVIGTIMLLISLIRLYLYHYTDTHHLGLTISSVYNHFVDVVWIIVYSLIYIWGS